MAKAPAEATADPLAWGREGRRATERRDAMFVRPGSGTNCPYWAMQSHCCPGGRGGAPALSDAPQAISRSGWHSDPDL